METETGPRAGRHRRTGPSRHQCGPSGARSSSSARDAEELGTGICQRCRARERWRSSESERESPTSALWHAADTLPPTSSYVWYSEVEYRFETRARVLLLTRQHMRCLRLGRTSRRSHPASR